MVTGWFDNHLIAWDDLCFDSTIQLINGSWNKSWDIYDQQVYHGGGSSPVTPVLSINIPDWYEYPSPRVVEWMVYWYKCLILDALGVPDSGKHPINIPKKGTSMYTCAMIYNDTISRRMPCHAVAGLEHAPAVVGGGHPVSGSSQGSFALCCCIYLVGPS